MQSEQVIRIKLIMKPNIVLFITHDQGQLLGCYNTPLMPNSLKTPNIDGLAANGIRFTNYFCTTPLCSPSRGSMITSKYPHKNGLMGLVNRGWSLPKTNKTLAMYLKENGYTTHLIGFQHESQDPSSLGYDTISKRDFKYTCKLMENEILRFFSDHKHDKDPFYLCIGTHEVHIPFKAWGDPVNPKNVKVPPFLPNHISIKKDLAELYGAIHTVDTLIGKILLELEINGLKDNTLFIYTTDHGIAFPRAKSTLYDPGIKILLNMSLPNSNLFNGGKVIDGILSNIDLFPTILDFIGGEIPKDIDGKTFLPILKDEKEIIRTEIFAEKTYHDKYDPIRGIRTKDYKYIRNFEKSDTLYKLPLDIFKSRSGKLIRKQMQDLYEKPRMEEELYNLEKDPNEKNNLINNPKYRDIASDLRKRLFNWMKETNDPLLKGKVEHQYNNKKRW